MVSSLLKIIADCVLPLPFSLSSFVAGSGRSKFHIEFGRRQRTQFFHIHGIRCRFSEVCGNRGLVPSLGLGASGSMASIKRSPSWITSDASLFRVFLLRSCLNTSRRNIGTKYLIECMANEIREQDVLEVGKSWQVL